MERKAKVTQAVVNTTCSELLQAGKNITVNAVINIVGGSFSTVGGMVKAWKEEQAAHSAPVIDMPEIIIKAMKKATTDIWVVASGLANEKVEQIQKESDEMINRAKTELVEYTGEVSRLENELEQEKKTGVNTESKLSDALEKFSLLTTQNAALETRLVDRDNELERLRADYKKLQAELIEIARGRPTEKPTHTPP